jgi:putative ABC transport system permease protein
VEQVKEHQRDTRSFRWLDYSWLDFKLGVRLLVKYPGLTLVGGLAIAFAIAVGAATFEFVRQVVYPTLPLDDGHRIVGIRLWHTAARGVEEQALYDFVSWRGQIRSVEGLGAFRTVERNLITGGVSGDPIMAAEISASAFAVARVPAVLGRVLVEADEQPGAPPVVVIGYDVWQTRFAGDPDVVSRIVNIGSSPSTVVGVMPEGFAFPLHHSLWVPLRPSDLSYGRRRGPWINIFGRLAPGASLAEAQAELTILGQRAAADHPDTHEHLRPQVMPYGQSVSPILTELAPMTLMGINIFFVMLLTLVCANVALLMFARATAREAEIAVRTALGASRGRIIRQLFGEALALGSVAAVAGLAAAGLLLRWWLDVSRAENGGLLPFWHHDSLAPATVLYAGVLTVLGAVIAGVVPSLKVTGRKQDARLRQATAGDGLGFGGVWTAVIVAQVAMTLAFPAAAYFVRQDVVQVRSLDPGFPAERYLSASLEMDPEFTRGSDVRAVFPFVRFRSACEELERRLTAESEVAGVSFADPLPLTYHRPRRIEVEGDVLTPSKPVNERRAGIATVGLNFFAVLGAPILSGRGFHAGDLDPDAKNMIVNESFVHRVLEGRSPIGQRVRELPDDPDGAPGPWLEIVGVVKDLGIITRDPAEGPGFYRPVSRANANTAHIVLHTRGEPSAFAGRLRAIGAAVEPTLRLHQVLPLNEVDRTLWLEFDFLFKLLVVVSTVALLLSLAGIYSVMSFTVSRRTREIGIRVALGADGRRIVAAIFRRPLAQVGMGVVAGGGLTAALALAVSGGVSAMGATLVAAYAALMLGICLLACIVPTRRALRIEPTEALRMDG